MPFETSQDVGLRYAKKRAIERMSRRCPVAIRVNKVLDSLGAGDHVDLEYVLDSISAELMFMPEAAATVEIIQKIMVKAEGK
jgi:hypothetical protein